MNTLISKKSNWNRLSWSSNTTALANYSADDLDQFFLRNETKSFKADKTTTVGLVSITEQNSTELYVIKRYNPRSQFHKIKRALRQTRARRCWLLSELFNQASLNVAKPVLLYEIRFGPIRLTSYFINSYLDGELLLDCLPSFTIEQQIKVKEELLRAFSIMQQQRLSHGDLKATNLLWYNEKLYFIDLDAAKQHTSKSSWNKAHAKDKKRFLKNWQSNPDLLSLFSDLA